MNILLISPLDPKNPGALKSLMGGENTYTRMLLRYPPQGVEFIHFEKALIKGSISYHPLQFICVWLQRFRILPVGPRVQAFRLHETFDLIYTHGYPVRIFGKKGRLVLSDSSSNRIFLEKYLHLPNWRLATSQKNKLFLFKLFDIVDGEVNSEKANERFVFSKWAQKMKQHYAKNSFNVIYPGLPIPNLLQRREHKELKLLFVGVWFERKGGRLVLSVFRKLAKTYTHIELTILGPLPADIILKRSERIIQKDFVSYVELQKHYATHQVLLHVPPEIEGYGMAVPEAMSYGMVPIVSNICALPEFVTHMKSGLIVKAGLAADLEEKIMLLVKRPELLRFLSRGARKKFRTQFSLPVFHEQLRTIFQSALLL